MRRFAWLALLLWAGLWPAAQARGLWLDARGQPLPVARQAIQWLLDAETHGLDPQDYHAQRWAQLLAGRLPAPAEAELEQDLLRYLHDLRQGRVPAQQLGIAYDGERRPRPDLGALLRQAARDGALASAHQAATPPWPDYAVLQEALIWQLALVGDPAWATPLPPLPGGKLVPGQAWSGLAQLARRLRLLGDLHTDAASEPQSYDAVLEEGLRAFQERHGLSVDGVLGKATLAALERTPQDRARQIVLALERLRMLPVPTAPRFITVNVPEFMLRAWEQEAGRPRMQLAMRTIVGRARHTQTPLFDEDMRWVEFHPYWNIPRSIILGETLPKMRANPDYLSRQGMEFVGPAGEISTAATPDMLAAVESGQWRVRQRPGPRNALGDIKFMLPNRQSIYLHHTPETGLFQRARRDFSHGCVRIEDPVALVLWVLHEDPDWNEARVRQTLAHPRRVIATLPTPVPVLMTYRTVSVHQGQLRFMPDIYRLDAALDQALRQRPPIPAANAGNP